ncbi:hypothetical protein [Methanosarcina sp.]|uniref:hypothetical protein n=1 Tax=Methanosarcina sp. TaxID=2213 RepID=UPI0029890C5D|nr:hypothetical protein [Methanosarcina sp.]MDW5549438.1 hypothetical protein [Methanosarcina sp.]MDW5553371.1 hypothetical protein [Methanosarcina sp.]MDW5559695.1 hypothetical protein [Methanosarcina sp.]
MHEHSQIQLSKNPESSPQRRSILTNQIHISSPADIIQRARIDPKSLASADVLQLQRTIGNRTVGKSPSEIFVPTVKTVQRQEIQEKEEPLKDKRLKLSDAKRCQKRKNCYMENLKPSSAKKSQRKSHFRQRGKIIPIR